MELILKSAEVTFPQAIENIEALKKELAPKMDYYASLVVTEDGIKAAKDDRAKLNKLKTAIEEQRKEAKKTALSLYEPLEKQCKELVALIDAPISAIDTQIKAFDEAEKEKKYKELQEYFTAVNNISFLKIEDVLNPKWGNKTVSLDMLKAEMASNIKKVIDDYEEINTLYKESPLLTAIQNKFAETKDKSKTLVYAATLERQYQQEQERKAKEAELQKQRETAQNVTESVSEPENEITHETTQTAEISEPEQPQSEPIIGGCFAIQCEKSKLIALRQYMKENGITIIGTMSLDDFRKYKNSKEEN